MAGSTKPKIEKPAAQVNRRTKSRALLVFYILVLLAVFVGAIFLCMFLFFQVNKVNISGTAKYTPEELVAASGVEAGDNLIFLDTDAVEDKIFREFPYIEQVKVKKQLPSIIDISVTEAKAVYSMEYKGNYVYVSSMGKILELAAAPKEDSILIKVENLGDKDGYISLPSPELQGVFEEVLAVFSERETGNISELDLRNIYDISLLYDGRITLKLGSSADISYKINFGLQIIDRGNIEAGAKGQLDLSSAKDTNKAYFTLDSLTSPAPGEDKKKAQEIGSGQEGAENSKSEEESGDGEDSSQDNSEGDDEESSQDSGDGDSGGDQGDGGEESSRDSTRGDDIPDV